MKENFSRMALFMSLTMCIMLLTGCPGIEGPAGPAGTSGADGSDGADGPSVATAPGLSVTIQGVVIPSNLIPEITFIAKDDAGITIGLDQFVGDRDVRFVLAYLDGSGAEKAMPVGKYMSYVTDDTGSATYDHNLSAGLTENADGTITYRMEHELPEDYDATATHQVGAQFTRTDLVTGATYDTNALLVFRPDGGEVTETREVSTIETCNKCHNELTLHGRRTELQYCILCHNPQSSDPDTGNSVDMAVLIHKIHMGANLPSVQAGTPYQIIGYRDSVHDYSNVHLPQPANNCVACHTDAVDGEGNPLAKHNEVWKTNPTAMACGACHDDVDFASGALHVGGAQVDDSNCAACHSATAIEGYHDKMIPKLVLGATADDISVSGEGLISVTFSAADTNGSAIADLTDTDKYRVGYLVGWPAEEYENYVGNSNMGDELTSNGGGSYTYTAAAGEEITAAAGESLGFVFRGRKMVDLDDDPSDNETRVPMEKAPAIFFRADGGEANARRTIVDDSLCANCHGEPFAGHGSDRIGVDVCVVCHNVNLVSEPNEGDPVTVNMKDMIHKIHRGANLESGFTTGGHGGDVDFTNIHFPGNLAVCANCHGDNDISLPLPDEALSTVVAVDANEDDVITPDEVLSETPPETASCTSCHDSDQAMAHATINTAGTVESCAVCHGPASDVDAAVIHSLQ